MKFYRYPGAGSWVGREKPRCSLFLGLQEVPMNHWRFRVPREPTMSGPGDPFRNVPICRSLRGWNVAWVPGFLFPPAVFP